MTNHQLVNQTSGQTDFWTPQPIIEAARRTMGAIDLDPASSAAANERVRATVFFSEVENGLMRDWGVPSSPSRVWLNHPFSRVANPAWINRLVNQYSSRAIEQACCITFASTSEKWFKPLLYYPQCFLVPRTDYLLPDGTKMRGVTKGSVVTYLGANIDGFAHEFKSLGVVKLPYPTASSPSQPR